MLEKSFRLVLGLIKIKNPLFIFSQIMDSAAKFKGTKDVKLQRPEVKVMGTHRWGWKEPPWRRQWALTILWSRIYIYMILHDITLKKTTYSVFLFIIAVKWRWAEADSCVTAGTDDCCYTNSTSACPRCVKWTSPHPATRQPSETSSACPRCC